WIQVDIKVPFEIKYNYKGMSFIFGKSGGIDYVKTYFRNKLKRFYKEIKDLPVEEYDLVISDFEPVAAWACHRKKKECIGLSNQVAVLAKNAPRPKNDDKIGRFVLKNYCPT